MSTINATAAATSTTELKDGTTTSVVNEKGSAMGKDAFLKMFVAQMQNQDPTSPMDSSQFTQQMATFSQVEQLTNLASNSEKTLQAQSIAQAVSLIGHTVSYADAATGSLKSGKVESVSTGGGTAKLTVDGVSGLDASAVLQVS